MERNDKNRLIALAAMFQASDLIGELAYKGQADQDLMQPLIHSVFDNSSKTIEAIYDGLDHLRPGFELAKGILINPGKGQKSMAITRYTVTLMHLQRKLEKNPQMADKLIEEIESTERQIEFFGGMLNPTVISRLADIYQGSISKMEPKIIVKGEQSYLDQADIAAQIRALLLAGIRSAVLWSQAGGGRFTLMMRRKQLAAEATKLLRPLRVVH